MRRFQTGTITRPTVRFVLTIQVLLIVAGSAAQAQRWSDVHEMPTPRYAAGAVGVEGRLYVLGGGATTGGNNWGPYTDVLESYDVARGRWSPGAPLPPNNLWDPVVEAVGGKIYLIGGFPYQVHVWEYDPALDTWTFKTDRSFGGGIWGTNSVSGVDAGKIILANVEWGGVFAYDPETNHAEEIDPRGYFRYRSQGGVIDRKLYFAGGLVRPPEGGRLVTTAEVEVYDIAAGEWATVAPMHTPRAYAAAEVMGGKLYVLGGWMTSSGTEYEPVHTMEVYDPETDTWTETVGLSDRRYGYAMAAVDDHMYVAGGVIRDPEADDELLSRVQRFDPGRCERIPPGLADGPGEIHGLPRAILHCPGSRGRSVATTSEQLDELTIERRPDRRLEIALELVGSIDAALEPLLAAHARAIAEDADAEGDRATAGAARILLQQLRGTVRVRRRE